MREVWPLLNFLAMLDETLRRGGRGGSEVVEDAALDQIVGVLDRFRDAWLVLEVVAVPSQDLSRVVLALARRPGTVSARRERCPGVGRGAT